MKYPLLVLAAALTAGTTQAHADIISYNMTGTITSASGSSSFAVGDHVTWTLQYDPSSPTTSGGVNSAGPWSGYSMPQTNMITNIGDQTTGYHFSLLPPSDTYLGEMELQNNNPSSYQHYPSGDIFAYENANGNGNHTSISLKLRAYGYLPTLNLANLRFNNLTLTSSPKYPLGPTSLDYNYLPANGVQSAFTSSVDSISGVTTTPEPGSITLILLGLAGLVIRRIRHLCPV